MFMAQGYYCTHAFPCKSSADSHFVLCIPMCSWLKATIAHIHSHVFMGQGNYCTHAFPCVHGPGQLLHTCIPMCSWLGALYYSECIINKYFLVRLLIKTLIFLSIIGYRLCLIRRTIRYRFLLDIPYFGYTRVQQDPQHLRQ
ncbi:hypothetical protein SAMN05720764_10564 [Fibrobacter sp. UWH5]|nr:hypothetical protein SAMN05720764_10564 [Fibrobacter sp. UWH5]